ncbi:MAG: hypothetical protein JKX70_09185 [Phycisphaerales bacterium]|nr:hypothetical protein [Phycisphaerales bacterium]
MALFARRKIQDSIEACAGIIPDQAFKKLIPELNSKSENSLPTEWEIMITAAVARSCPVEYEPDLGGTSRGDLLIRPGGTDKAGCLVEITTISDRSMHKKNPYDQISTAIRRKLLKMGCPSSAYSIEVPGETEGEYGNARMKLHLGTGHAKDLFDQDFREFARCIKTNPSAQKEHHWQGPNLDIKVIFNPNAPFHGGGHPSYTTPYSPTKNPLYKALKSKCSQLSNTGHDGPCGLIICDGGCSLLTNTLDATGGAASLHSIMLQHFSNSSRLSFVLVIYAELPLPTMLNGMRRERNLKQKIFLRTDACQLSKNTLDVLKTLPKILPRPLLTGENAANCYKNKWEDDPRHGRHGSMTTTNRSIQISARAVLDMLAGTETPEQFFAGYSRSRSSAGNQFLAHQIKGRLIESVQLVKGEDDDDIMEFRFGEPDMAVREFQLPAQPRPE